LPEHKWLGSVAGADLKDIHWAIVRGESGPRARPMLELWVDEIEAMCRKLPKPAPPEQARGNPLDFGSQIS
jgi:protein gp37